MRTWIISISAGGDAGLAVEFKALSFTRLLQQLGVAAYVTCRVEPDEPSAQPVTKAVITGTGGDASTVTPDL